MLIVFLFSSPFFLSLDKFPPRGAPNAKASPLERHTAGYPLPFPLFLSFFLDMIGAAVSGNMSSESPALQSLFPFFSLGSRLFFPPLPPTRTGTPRDRCKKVRRLLPWSFFSSAFKEIPYVANDILPEAPLFPFPLPNIPLSRHLACGHTVQVIANSTVSLATGCVTVPFSPPFLFRTRGAFRIRSSRTHPHNSTRVLFLPLRKLFSFFLPCPSHGAKVARDQIKTQARFISPMHFFLLPFFLPTPAV